MKFGLAKYDYWVAWDKFYHLVVCIVLTFFFGWITALSFGVLKEIRDGLWGNGASWKDMVANCIGIGIGLWIKGLIL